MSPENTQSNIKPSEDQEPLANNAGGTPPLDDQSRQNTARQSSTLLNDVGGRLILTLQQAYDKLVAGRVTQIESQLIDQDRELSLALHDLAELTAQVTQMNRRLQKLEQRLQELESDMEAVDSE